MAREYQGESPRANLEAHLRRERAQHRMLQSRWPVRHRHEQALKAEFGCPGQFEWLRQTLAFHEDDLTAPFDFEDPLQSYAGLFEEYINPSMNDCYWARRSAAMDRKHTVFPGGPGWKRTPMTTVLATHTGWLQSRMEEPLFTLDEAVAIGHRQLDVHGRGLVLLRIVTFSDLVYAGPDGWEAIAALGRRIHAQGTMFHVISWSRTPLADSVMTDGQRDADNRETKHIRNPSDLEAPHWRTDRWVK